MKCPVCGQAFSPKGLAIHTGMKHNPDGHGLRAEIARLRAENASLGILIELHEDERARILAAVEALPECFHMSESHDDHMTVDRQAVLDAIKGEATDD